MTLKECRSNAWFYGGAEKIPQGRAKIHFFEMGQNLSFIIIM